MGATGLPVHICLLILVIFYNFETSCGSENDQLGRVAKDDVLSYNITFFPATLDKLVWEKTSEVEFQVHSSDIQGGYPGGDGDSEGQMCIISEDPSIAVIEGDNVISYSVTNSDNEPSPNMTYFTVRGVFLGRTRLKVLMPASQGLVINFPDAVRNYTNTFESNYSLDVNTVNTQCGTDNNQKWIATKTYLDVAVVRPERIVDKIFIGFVSLLVIVANIGMGCKIDLAVVKEVLRRPIAPIIGFCCQFVIMPIAAFGFAKAFGLRGGIALGFFATGCAPGGGSSNMYTFLLNGDVSLSVTMTLISLVASIGMIPLWIYTLGSLFLKEHGIKIPYQNIVISMVVVLLPVGIGLLIQKKKPKAAQFIVKRILRVWFIFIILFMFTFGIWTNVYVFQLITPTMIIAGCLLPYTGFIISGLAAFVLRQPLNRILTIAIETGIQNTGIPIILMKFTLPQPEGDMSIVGPVVVAMFTPLPLWIAIAVQEIRKRCCKKSHKAEEIPDIDFGGDLNNGTLLSEKVDTGLGEEDEATFEYGANGTKKIALSETPLV